MDVIEAIISLILFLLMIYLISRVAHFFNDTRKKLNEIEQKIAEIQAQLKNG